MGSASHPNHICHWPRRRHVPNPRIVIPDGKRCAMQSPDFWPDIRRFLLAFTASGLLIGLYTLLSVQPLP